MESAIVPVNTDGQQSWWKTMLFGGKTEGVTSCSQEAYTNPACSEGVDANISGLEIDSSSLDRGCATVGSPVTFNLAVNGECINPDDLEVELRLGTETVPMEYKHIEGFYSASPPADKWGPPYCAEVRDRYSKELLAERCNYDQLCVKPEETEPPEKPAECWPPVIYGQPQVDPPEPYIREPVTVYKSRNNIIPQCNSTSDNKLHVNFVLGERSYSAEMDGENYYLPDIYFNQPGYYEITLVAKQAGLSSSKDKGFNVKTLCQNDPSPKYSPYAISIPPEIYESDLQNGVQARWKLLGKNCDESIQGVELFCRFSYVDGSEEFDTFYPDPGGDITINKTLYKKFDKPPTCDLYFIDPNDPGNQHEIKKAVTLYGPDILP